VQPRSAHVPETPPRDLLKPKYGASDIHPDAARASRQAADQPEAFGYLADVLGSEPLPFDFRAWALAADYNGRTDLATMLRGHVYRLAIPDIGSHHALASRLDAQPKIADRLGFESVPGRDTFRRAWRELEAADREEITGYAAALRRRVAATGVPGAGALNPEYDTDEELTEVPAGEKARAVEHLRAFHYDRMGFERAYNTTYHCDELLDLQAEVSREQGFVQGTIEDRWTDGEECHTPKTHFNAIQKRSLDDWRETFDGIFEMQVEAAKNAGMLQRKVPIHIDATIIPYFKRGKDRDLPRGVTGNAKARGTHYGYKHVTVSALDNGRSICLATFDITDRAQIGDAVKHIVRKAEERIHIESLSMDSEFLKNSVVDWLDERGIEVTIQMARRGNRLKRKLVQMDGHFDQDTYDLGKSDYYNPTITGTVVAERDYDEDEPDGPEPGGGLEASNLAMFGGGVDLAEVELDEIDDQWWRRWRPYFTNADIEDGEEQAHIRKYKRRWAIETKYRIIKEEFLGKTTARDYTSRTFFWLFAVMLYNAWVLLDVFMRADYPDLVPGDRPAMPARTFAKQFFAIEPG